MRRAPRRIIRARDMYKISGGGGYGMQGGLVYMRRASWTRASREEGVRTQEGKARHSGIGIGISSVLALAVGL